MENFLIKIRKTDIDPTGKGDPISWFLHYKWNDEGEVYYPLRSGKLPLFEGIAAGDRLWVCLEDAFLGHVEILRVEPDHFNGHLELWFDTRHRDTTVSGLDLSSVPEGRCIAPEVAKEGATL